MFAATFSKVTPEQVRKVVPVGNILPAYRSYEVIITVEDGHDEGRIVVKGGERHPYILPIQEAFQAAQTLHQA